MSTAGSVRQIIAFGDSYLDSGALFRLSDAAVKAGVPHSRVLPAPQASTTYAPGRWSDGDSMVEVMADLLGATLTNYAIGGAKATFGNYHAWLDYYADTGLAGQIDGYEVALRGQRAASESVYVVSAGANDFFQFHDFAQPGYVALADAPRLSVAALGARAARGVAHAVARLALLGAREFVALDAYALAATPWAGMAGAAEPARSYAAAFDATLALELDPARLAPGVRVTPFRIGERMQQILQDAATHGITNTRDACQPVLPTPGPRRGDAAAFFWWDECHPTARVHSLLGAQLAALLQPAT